MSDQPVGTWTRGLSVPATQTLGDGTVITLAVGAAQTLGTLPLNVNLVLYRGDDFYLDVTVVDTNGGAVDLTGFTAQAELRPDTTAGTALASFTETISGNVIHLHLPASEALNLLPDTVWDVQLTDATGVVTTLAYGDATTTPDVTRP